MNLNYDEYGEEVDLDLLYKSSEPIDPVVRDEEVNPDLEGMGRQYLE